MAETTRVSREKEIRSVFSIFSWVIIFLGFVLAVQHRFATA